MTSLRDLNRAVQSATYPGHEWAQGVRDMLNEVAERMEPASEGAKVECPNCGQPGEHYHSGDMPHVPAFYTCQPAQPEPAQPAEMPEAERIDDKTLAHLIERFSRKGHHPNILSALRELSHRRSQPAPALRVTEELERVLSVAELVANGSSSPSQSRQIHQDVAAVRAQRKP